MKRFLSIAMMLAVACGMMAQTKLDPGALRLVENYKADLSGDTGLRIQQPYSVTESTASSQPTDCTLIVTLNEGYDASLLANFGVEVVSSNEAGCVVNMPIARIESMAELDGVRYISAPRLYKPTLYFAREATDANGVLDGTAEGLEQPYTGAGVVTGLMDTGLDPNHINFMNSDLTDTRVEQFYVFNGYDGTPSKSYTTKEEVKTATTDNKNESHGTHVSGIMAGSYKGTGTYGLQGKVYKDKDIPFYGLGGSSAIVMNGGSLYDANIVAGVQKVIEYGEKVGKPVVVNLSLGSVVGPHDGSGYCGQSFANLGKRAIICIAAGNDGTQKLAVSRKLSAGKTKLQTCINQTDFSSAQMAQFWYTTSDRFKFEFCLYSTIEDAIVGSVEYTKYGNYQTVNASDATIGELFGQAFASGALFQMVGGVNGDDNRYYVQVTFKLNRDAASDNTLLPAVRITGKSGQTITGYINGGTFESNDISGWQDGTSNGSISDMACGENVIVVGSFTSSATFSTINGTRYSVSATKNDVSDFSSYGVTASGVELPNLCAPGQMLVSSVNYYEYGSNPGDTKISASADANDRPNQWAWMQGTSMACPFTAGTVALMLEADPTLNVDEVRNILMETATSPGTGLTENKRIQWGAGRINVLAAVKKTLENKSALGTLFADDQSRLVITPMGDAIEVFMAGEKAMNLRLVSINGRSVASAKADADRAVISTRGLAKGIYVLEATTPGGRIARKVAVK